MPALMTGLAGALVFWLARRHANEWTALLTWRLWTTSWANLHWSATYFSETTSTAMWLIALWATIRWLDSGRGSYLLSSPPRSMGIQHAPLTMAALSLPLAFVILRLEMATKAWSTLPAPVVLGAAVLAPGRCGISRRSATGGSIRGRSMPGSTSPTTSRASAPIPRLLFARWSPR